jgi:SAM-dependent methyltransferase
VDASPPHASSPVQQPNSILARAKRRLPLVSMSRSLSRTSRAVAAKAHKLQYTIEWGADNPEYFDHFMDQHWQWTAAQQSFPWERGVYSSLALQATRTDSLPKVLELCCGDGFMTHHFYAGQSLSILAIDFDRSAISSARKNFKSTNVTFTLGDIRTDIPNDTYDNIIWDAAIEHFTEVEINELMSTVKSRLNPDGILSGYTIIEPDDGGKHLHQHEYEFHDKEDLARFLAPWFRNVQVFQTDHPARQNLYFWASDSKLPLDRSLSLRLTTASE